MNSNIIYQDTDSEIIDSWGAELQDIKDNVSKDKSFGVTEESMELYKCKKFKEFMASKHICWYQDTDALLWYGLEHKKEKVRCIYDKQNQWSPCNNCRDFQLQRKIKLLGQIVPDIVQFEIWKCLTMDEIHFCKFCQQPKQSSISECYICWN